MDMGSNYQDRSEDNSYYGKVFMIPFSNYRGKHLLQGTMDRGDPMIGLIGSQDGVAVRVRCPTREKR